MKTPLFLTILVWLVSLAPAIAQTPPAQPPNVKPAQPPNLNFDEEPAGLMQGWALLAQRQGLLADGHAARLQQKFPRSLPVAVLAVDAALAAGNGPGAIDRYDAWQAGRPLEEPALLHRLALGLLRLEADRPDSTARLDALRILMEDPDGGGKAVVEAAAARGGRAELKLLASIGHEASVKQLADELRQGAGDKVATLEILGQSGSAAAGATVAAMLNDPRPEVRGAAAEALARLPGASAGRLKPLLQDDSSFVRVRAAAALLRLRDATGIPLLQELLSGESGTTRLVGAEALSVAPDTAWLESVRALGQDPDPTVRAGAARLLAARDPDAARTIAATLAEDANPAIRDLATRVLARTIGRDLTAARRLLRSTDALTRVQAAGALLAATR